MWKWDRYPHVHVLVFQLRLASRGVESDISMMCTVLHTVYKSESIYDSYCTHWNIRRPQSYLVFSTSLEVRFCNGLCNPLKYLFINIEPSNICKIGASTTPLIPASLLESWILNPSTIHSSNQGPRTEIEWPGRGWWPPGKLGRRLKLHSHVLTLPETNRRPSQKEAET